MSRSLWFVLAWLLTACASTPEKRVQTTEPAAAAAPATGAAARPVVKLDSDGDEVADVDDACPLEAGDAPGIACPARYGYFFLRVINAESLPVSATLAFQPVVNRIVAQDDGYAGMLRPGVYQVRAEAEGYDPAELRFEVQANQKALIELKLYPLGGESP